MGLLTERLLRAGLPPSMDGLRPPARRAAAERVVLPVRTGHRPSPLPPVRIFVGSERNQFRAERTLLWSIAKHRDPGRVYEIHLLRDLSGFRRRLWLTGFTNYRFAIPALAGRQGRAIYNDADQVYLTDPARLFDQDLGAAGYLSIDPRDTSVMLIDCERMAGVWALERARQKRRKELEAEAEARGLWGALDPAWNARDDEYRCDSSHVVHFTALHTQPWRPFPEQFVYFENPAASLWHALEAEADAARFLPFDAAHPSSEWSSALARLATRIRGSAVEAALTRRERGPRTGILTVGDVLEHVPDLDVPWVLERLLGACEELELEIREPVTATDSRHRRTRGFWLQQLELASRLHPEGRWRLRHHTLINRTVHRGGSAPAGKVIVLVHRKPGHNQQARAVARRLAERSGRTLEEIMLPMSAAGWAGKALLRRPPPAIPADAAVVVASSWLCTRVARQLARRRTHLRLVLCGRKAGRVPDSGAVIVQCAHFNLPPHPSRLITTLPLNAGETQATLNPEPWRAWLDSERRYVLLVGGGSRFHTLTRNRAAEMVRRVASWAERDGASLLVVTGRRSAHLAAAIEPMLPPGHRLYRWMPDDPDNPYQLALREAHQLVVTGESESMLSDAVSRGRKFLVWPLPARSGSLWQRIASRAAERAVRPRRNRRGSLRPQQGLTYLCARAIERGFILPPREINALHDRLYRLDQAAPFGQAVELGFDPGSELEHTVLAAMQRLGISDAKHAAPARAQAERAPGAVGPQALRAGN